MKPVIISIDWDWVTGDCSLGFCCCGMCGKNSYYKSKGRGSKKKLHPFWAKRLEELKNIPVYINTPIFVAESHGSIGEVFYQYFKPIVVDYDSHCDRYNSRPIIDCANWIIHLEKHGGEYFKFDDEYNYKFVNAVFVCRSAPWTPKEMDNRFNELVWNLCFQSKTDPKFIGHMRKSLRKSYISQFSLERPAI